ncbi:CDP-Glycerol:Poly(glycerophosphate) glycerophosphotransferase [uncultured Clostridium sp.]|uniref:CDP-glycerol glycerophosphotransferase family protein n=1 Tax=uncultured Clostridium sp. TaxID=59620 RepID=UPI0008219EFF|nr:CDP-glycerol glycerophosphotransferase family protein [uncultured Clostridium sp.]SCJ41516.1 CDP-Glycerol:Poly(glycerophosphate) glycerophosphotransferase [uncultured Clostridium sp.]
MNKFIYKIKNYCSLDKGQNKIEYILTIALKRVYNLVKEILAFLNLIKLRLKKREQREKITVVFLYQMPELWNKMKSVCEELNNRCDIDVIILTIPKINIDDGSYLENEALEAIRGTNYKIINAIKGENKWIDLKEINPDYVFYQRPYDEYLPEEYKSYNVIKYAKTCYIPYGWVMTTNLQECCFNREFFRNLYMYFAENEEAYNIVKNQSNISDYLGIKRVLSLGCPSLELVYKIRGTKSYSWKRERENDKLRIMWTPRWTIDPNLCASNFFQYKDKFIEYAELNREKYILFRPHPLAFDNYLKCGLMTKDEIDMYLDKIDRLENISLDNEKDYLNTFWESDILVTDISAIIVEYFITGKPIIYCDNGTAPLDNITTKMSEGFYWVKNWDEIEETIRNIESGNDILFNRRQELIKELFDKNTINSTVKITESIINDYRNQ